VFFLAAQRASAPGCQSSLASLFRVGDIGGTVQLKLSEHVGVSSSKMAKIIAGWWYYSLPL